MTKLDWDYTGLAKAYINRPDYSDAAIDAVLAIASPPSGQQVIDLGAGVAHLTLKLAERGLDVLALEPNAEMRRYGTERTEHLPKVTWKEGVMQATGLPDASFPLTTYGSSFGVTDRIDTLRESARLLADGGWFVCMFNHRDLTDPLQTRIEGIITAHVPDYDYGTRREDQGGVIAQSGLFGPVHRLECPIVHHVDKDDWVTAWRSHATLERQTGAAFHAIVDEIADVVGALPGTTLPIPYMTRVWMARRLPR
ncbi:methyltransferase domain-containing protein [Ponticoccus sp. SC2-23]|uniref:class I SAM-dependent methyltransferase n=1 Tax=Alexandriicola marinus TaxID=2081710 RepID=UPI000FDA163F|nr:methyltransferase domain-containing protein [Alexandriicola marinus]MBM1218696.1 methyltransferase domain-containing protein [Ponticoccus sp. SC6-9]MBM1224232.1 methyltransferase domain-containing protein [Ponticoccus sp. SC6-15]MBM1229989.1 methyltransferase domain-containing protein [Ponticoccus sp. SC6-38]MBM1233198.1 methyltransferase domain-containing protein [Ponticoccus sp. SC6-45]MBM1236852.1 methyltransferase domain-containing protein [Ponticoccus sp. SC6-49]MBM1242209.1 methyltra